MGDNQKKDDEMQSTIVFNNNKEDFWDTDKGVLTSIAIMLVISLVSYWGLQDVIRTGINVFGWTGQSSTSSFIMLYSILSATVWSFVFIPLLFMPEWIKTTLGTIIGLVVMLHASGLYVASADQPDKHLNPDYIEKTH